MLNQKLKQYVIIFNITCDCRKGEIFVCFYTNNREGKEVDELFLFTVNAYHKVSYSIRFLRQIKDVELRRDFHLVPFWI